MLPVVGVNTGELVAVAVVPGVAPFILTTTSEVILPPFKIALLFTCSFFFGFINLASSAETPLSNSASRFLDSASDFTSSLLVFSKS